MTKRISVVVAILVVGSLMGGDAFAKSKTFTVKTRCVVKPMIQLSSASLGTATESSSELSFGQAARSEFGLSTDGANVSVRSNLAEGFRQKEEIRQTANGERKLVTLFAL